MKKYMVIYHAPAELMNQTADSSPEEMDEGMKEWMTWAARCGEKLLDLGNPLVGGQKLIPDGSSEGSTRGVSGYSILQAESFEDARDTVIRYRPPVTLVQEGRYRRNKGDFSSVRYSPLFFR